MQTPPDTSKDKAEELHQEAIDLRAAGDDDAALKKYFEVLQHDFSRSSTHYNIGLIYKYRKQWPESFRYNKRAVELAPDDEASNWNLAIAATALGDWRTAREVWLRLGMPIEEGTGQIEQDFGVTPVRLNSEDEGEVVWGRRIDPVRIRILNIPYPKSGFRYGDVVLHDGAPVGYRESKGREYAVFNALQLFASSSYNTYEATLSTSNPQDLDDLQVICDEMDIPFEDWTTSVRTLCKQCSEGRPHQHHDKDMEAQWDSRHLVGFAATGESVVKKALNRWQNEGRKVEGFDFSLGPIQSSDG